MRSKYSARTRKLLATRDPNVIVSGMLQFDLRHPMTQLQIKEAGGTIRMWNNRLQLATVEGPLGVFATFEGMERIVYVDAGLKDDPERKEREELSKLKAQ